MTCVVVIGGMTRKKHKTLVTCGVDRSLSYGVSSIKKQKTNFKIINLLFRRVPVLKKILKKISLFCDDLYWIPYTPETTDVFGDPSYRYSILNMFHK